MPRTDEWARADVRFRQAIVDNDWPTICELIDAAVRPISLPAAVFQDKNDLIQQFLLSYLEGEYPLDPDKKLGFVVQRYRWVVQDYLRARMGEPVGPLGTREGESADDSSSEDAQGEPVAEAETKLSDKESEGGYLGEVTPEDIRVAEARAFAVRVHAAANEYFFREPIQLIYFGRVLLTGSVETRIDSQQFEWLLKRQLSKGEFARQYLNTKSATYWVQKAGIDLPSGKPENFERFAKSTLGKWISETFNTDVSAENLDHLREIFEIMFEAALEIYTKPI